MEMRRLIPVAGKVVRDPITRQILSEDGAMKPLNSYWQRRIDEGGCTIEKKGAKK